MGFQQLNQKKNASWGVNYGYTNLALAFQWIDQQQDYMQAPEVHTLDANFRIKTSEKGILKYYGYMTANRLAFTTPSLDSNGMFDRFALRNFNVYHNLSWKEQLAPKWRLQAGFSFSNNRDDLSLGLQDSSGKNIDAGALAWIKQFDVENRGLYANARLVMQKRFRGLTALRFGTEYNHSTDRSNFIAFNGQRFPGTIRENLFALFAEQDLYITNQLAGKLGMRAEYSALLNRYNIAPRISFAYKLGRNGQASLAYGQFFQNPELRHLPALQPLLFQKATHYIAQYQRTTNLTTLRAEIFFKQYDQLIKTAQVNQQLRASGNDGWGEAAGFELFWRDKKTIKNLDYWISYSYLDTRRDFGNFPFAITPHFAAKHTASLVMKKFVTPWKTNINLSYSYASGRPFYNIQPDAINNGKFVFADRGITIPYHNLSVAFNYLPNIGKKDAKTFIVYVLSVNNVLNFRQQFGYNYSWNGQRRQEIVPPSRMFVFAGVFISLGVDRTEDAINNNL